MYYLLFDSPKTAEYYNNLVSDPATRIKVAFPSGYTVTDADVAELYQMNMDLQDLFLS